MVSRQRETNEFQNQQNGDEEVKIGALDVVLPVANRPPDSEPRAYNDGEDVGVDRVRVRIGERQLNLVLEVQERAEGPTLVDRRKQSY